MAAKVEFLKFGNPINGQSRSGKEFSHGVNPSNKQPLWDIPLATKSDLDDAVSAAQNAFLTWSATPWEKRQACLKKASEILLERREDMANLLSLEGGKPPMFAQLEVEHAAEYLKYCASHPPLQPSIIQDDEELTIKLRHVPIGVVAAICPWNFPLLLSMSKISAALITGNCVIVKPSPYTPYSILKFIELTHHLFPAGVMQGLNGTDDLGPWICKHPGISKITFTGSIPTGKKVMESASSTLKNVTLELGGNSASIVCPDVDIVKVAQQIALGSFFNSGQVCVASKRIYVHESIYEKFLSAFTRAVGTLKAGPAQIRGNMLGPVQNEMQYQKVTKIIEDCKEKGYKFAVGEKAPIDSSSFVLQPTVIDRPPEDSLIVVEEPFGPIVPLLSWSNEDELIARVNDTTTGLGGAVWSADVARAERIGERIESGTVWINHIERPLPQAFFSGHKESGIGGEWGSHGLLSYTNAQCSHVYKASIAPGQVLAQI